MLHESNLCCSTCSMKGVLSRWNTLYELYLLTVNTSPSATQWARRTPKTSEIEYFTVTSLKICENWVFLCFLGHKTRIWHYFLSQVAGGEATRGRNRKCMHNDVWDIKIYVLEAVEHEFDIFFLKLRGEGTGSENRGKFFTTQPF